MKQVKFPIRIQHKDDGTIVIMDKDGLYLFHIVERDHRAEFIVHSIAERTNAVSPW